MRTGAEGYRPPARRGLGRTSFGSGPTCGPAPSRTPPGPRPWPGRSSRPDPALPHRTLIRGGTTIDQNRPATRQLRVVSVPSGHPYVAALAAPGSTTGVVRLPDPVPAGATDGRWWPPVAVDGGWIRRHADEFDLLHLHFGTESFDLGHLRDVVDALRETGRPLVYTVHDLENPQLVDQAPHAAQLDLLVPAADELITLTAGAAAEIERRWGRTATVVAHPNVLPLDAEAPVGRPSSAVVVGTSLRDLRPNVDGPGTVAALLAAADLLRAEGVEVVVRVDLNEAVRDEEARGRVAALVAAHPGAELVVHPRLGDAELAAALADLDAVVLPYRHGTHSGWAELCWDLGVPVVAPLVGFSAGQHPGSTTSVDLADTAALVGALRSLTGAEAARPGSSARGEVVAARRARRREERDAVDGVHRSVYDRALLGVARRASPSTASSPDGSSTGAQLAGAVR